MTTSFPTVMRVALAVSLFALSLAAPATGQSLDELRGQRVSSADARPLAFAAGYRASAPPPAPVRAIAEFERSEAVMVSHTDWMDVGDALPADLIVALAENVRVIVLFTDAYQEAEIAAAYAEAGVAMANLDFVQIPTDTHWTRDYGAMSVADGDRQIGFVDFIYSVPSWPLDNSAPAALGAHLGVPVYAMDLVHIGGNYMTTGAGHAASADRVVAYNDGDEARVRQQMQEYLGIDEYLLFPDPQNTYIDHIDTWGKFLDVDKILIAQAAPGHEDYENLEAIAETFAATPSPWGTPYQVVRVFAPDRQPYTNSLILNDHVYVPTSDTDPELDAAALQTYRDAMPGYTVTGYPSAFYWGATDALHCRVKEIADTGMLSVRHTPLPAQVPGGGDITFDAEIIAYSGQPITEGSARLRYSIDGADYASLPLAAVGGSTYRATLSAPPTGTEVSYYLTASDASGRTETFPLVGAAAPRTFTIAPPVAGEDTPTAALALGVSPNPVAGRLSVRFTLPAASSATLDVVDALGRTVARLHDGPARAGENEASWEPRGVAPGVYLVRLTADGARAVQRVTVAR